VEEAEMDSEKQQLLDRIAKLETRADESDEKTKQLAQVLASLAEVAQQMVNANTAVMTAIEALRNRKP
jgi:ABC-type transporter Mla subunit MlaD